jgi:hypothetical protein
MLEGARTTSEELQLYTDYLNSSPHTSPMPYKLRGPTTGDMYGILTYQ